MFIEKVVIGSTVEAAYYAFVNECYFIPNNQTVPQFYEKISIPMFGFRTKLPVWSRLLLMMGLMGKLIEYDNFKNIKISENVLKISADNTSYKFVFKELIIFDTVNISMDNICIISSDPQYKVFDTFSLSSMGKPKKHIDPYESQNKFFRKLHFYNSNRVLGYEYITDCIVESILTRDQLNCQKYSDSIVKIMVERHLSSLGIKGTFMFKYPSGKNKYRRPKVKHIARVTIEEDQNLYQDLDNVFIKNMTLKEIVNESSTQR